MDMGEEKEHLISSISSDEYSDDNDYDDALMNDAVTARNHNVRAIGHNDRNKQPKWRIDQKQKELSSLIRRNKISIIYKNKSIRWLNSKWKRERYKKRIYLNANNSTIGQITSTTLPSLEQQLYQNPDTKSSDQKYNTMLVEEAHTEQTLINNKIVVERNAIVQLPSTGALYKKTTNLQQESHEKFTDKKSTVQEDQNIKKDQTLTTSVEKSEVPGKRTRSTSPSILNESTNVDITHIGKKCRAVSPQFYKSVNDIFPQFDKIATNHIDSFANNFLSDVEDKIKKMSNEIDTLNEILQTKEMEWNRLSHLKMVKEEILSRLNKKRHILQLKESFSNKQDENILLELKELEFYLTESKTTPEINHSSITIQKLIDNRANMNADDLKREKNNTSRLHSLLVSQNMLNAAESLENASALTNGEKMDLELTNKNSETYNHLEGGRLVNNRGRQGEVRDVRSLIADFRQKNPELLPRVGKRIKSAESNTQRQGYSIQSFEKTSHSQLFTKDHHPEFYLLPNSVDKISGRSKQLSSRHDIDIFNAVNNRYNLRLEDNFLKSQEKGDFIGKSARNIQYPLCQECKIKESRFVCAGCGHQWYCSKKCQITAWDKHSDLCTE